MNEEFRANVEKWDEAWKSYDANARDLAWDPSSKVDALVNSNGKVALMEFAYFVVEMRLTTPSLPIMDFILDRLNVNEAIQEVVREVKTAESGFADWIWTDKQLSKTTPIMSMFFQDHPEFAKNQALRRMLTAYIRVYVQEHHIGGV